MKPTYAVFGDKKTENDFAGLAVGKTHEKTLHKAITRAIADLKQDPSAGIKIPKHLWPNRYVREHNITNLWKHNLPHGWRLTYTIKEDETMRLCVIIEWFDHKEYERRFGY